MREVKAALAASGIPYREDDKGYLRFAAKHAQAVDQIKAQIEKEMSTGIAWKVDNPAEREYLSKLLSSMGRKHWVQARDDGEWILWNPQNETEMREVQTNLVRFRIGVRSNTSR